MSFVDRRVQSANVTLNAADHRRLGMIADREGGLSLGPGKEQFMVSRLSHRLSALNIESYGSYADLLESSSGRDEVRRFIECLTTHTTSFFRGPAHFSWLEATGFPEVHKNTRNGQDVTIWSAACSSGQELYSALILATELSLSKCPGLRTVGIGTDLSQAILRKAATSVYFRDEIDGLSEERRRKFLLSSKADDGRYRIVSELRDRTTWRNANLVQAGTLSAVTADIAFLRNVLIYFDEETKDRAIRNVVQRIKPGGVLITGPSETLNAQNYGLTSIKPSIYKKGPA